MKTIMVIGVGTPQVYMLQKARHLGLRTIAIEGDPQAPGLEVADIAYNIPTTHVEKIAKIAERHHIDGVTTIASDTPLAAVARVGKNLGLKHTLSEETAIISNDKGYMRRHFEKYGLPGPRYEIVNSIDDAIAFLRESTTPIVMKPLTQSGGRGAKIVTDEVELRTAYTTNRSYLKDEFLVEEYLRGLHTCVNTFTIDGKTSVIATIDRKIGYFPNLVETEHSYPSMLLANHRKQAEEISICAVEASGLLWGPSHIDLVVTDAGAQICEIGTRLDGGFKSTHLIPLATGIDILSATLMTAIGVDNIDITPKFQIPFIIQNIFYPPGTICAINCIEEAKRIEGIVDVLIKVKVGHRANPVNSLYDMAGVVMAEGTQARESISNALSILEFQVDSEELHK